MRGRWRVLSVVLLAACVVANSASAGSRQTPKRGGTAVVGVPASAEPSCFNPFVVACYRGIRGVIAEDLIFARPFSHGPGGTFRPDLVSGVTVTKTPVTVTYHIRPEARSSDGRPVTAFDWQFFHGAAMRSEAARAFLAKDSWLWKVTRWRALDAKTFRMWVSEPVSLPAAKDYFALGLGPRHVMSTADLSSSDFWRDTIVDGKTGRPIGSGPFLMQSRKRGQSITLVRNPRYWGSHLAYLDKLVFRFLPEDELADALRQGEIDLILPFPRAEEAVQEIRRTRPPGVRVDARPNIRMETLMIRVGAGGHPALKKTQVRQALAYGIDRAGLLRTLGRGVFGRTAQPPAPPESLVKLAQHPAYEPNWQRYHYRPALARRLLTQAGCRPGSDGIRVCDGERISLRIGTTAGVESRRETFDFLQTNLRAIGVELKPAYFVAPSYPWDALADGDLDLAVWAWIFDWGVGSFNPYVCNSSNNFTGYCSRLVDREADNADRVVTDDARDAALNRVDRLLANAVPAIPLYQHTGQAAHRTTLRIPNLDAFSTTWNAADWWLAAEQ